MNRTLIIPNEIVTADSKGTILKNYAIEISGTVIEKLIPLTDAVIKSFTGEVVYADNLTVIPGFVQTHIHLCQTLFRGLADDLLLLDWLQQRIFPFEQAHDSNSLRISAQLGINELFLGGTTTLLDMGTINYQEVIFEELTNSGIKAFAGKCMMDQNDLFPTFRAETKDELEQTYRLAKAFHQTSGGRINYGFAPRFVLSCSEKLLIETTEMMKEFPGSIFHTHSSENKDEIEAVRKLRGKENVEYLNSIAALHNHTVLAHCIHLNDEEVKLLKEKETRVSHCPSSNLKLGSGIADIPRYLKEGISVSLGADGAPCNNNLNAFVEMRLASLIQKPIHGPQAMDAETTFRLATIEGAKALHIENKTGSIEAGKKADLVFLNLEKFDQPLSEENIYSKIVYSASKENVEHVMSEGEWVVKAGASLVYNSDELYKKGKEELNNLLKRVGSL
ncbi:MAG: amidohydrolase family protein [Ignavibacteriaceae bacterium]|nr:amidohydrolase family protein [Ignavibacteriaceae bacterium]